jgi:hypothetical protein
MVCGERQMCEFVLRVGTDAGAPRAFHRFAETDELL